MCVCVCVCKTENESVLFNIHFINESKHPDDGLILNKNEGLIWKKKIFEKLFSYLKKPKLLSLANNPNNE